MDKDNILEVKDLHVDIRMTEGLLTAVRGVNFEIKKGETLGLVGESGCGKSLTCKAILGINEKKCVSSGEILFDSEQHGEVELIDLANQKKNDKIRSIRGNGGVPSSSSNLRACVVSRRHFLSSSSDKNGTNSLASSFALSVLA